MLDKHLGLPKFYAPSKVLTLRAEKFSGESGRSVKTFAKLPGESLAEVNAERSSDQLDQGCWGARCKKFAGRCALLTSQNAL